MSAKDVMSDAAHALAPDPEEVNGPTAQKLENGGPNERDMSHRHHPRKYTIWKKP